MNIETFFDDHLSGSQYLKRRFNAPVSIGAAIIDVQKVFAGVFDLGSVASDGSQFDRLLADLPRPHANGQRYLTIPLGLKIPTDDDGTPT